MPVYLEPMVPAALLCAIVVDGDDSERRALSLLVDRFGPIAAISASYPLATGGYYAREMGAELNKKIVCFADLVDPATLAQAKLAAMDMERSLARKDGEDFFRRANIDPGLLSIESLVLATSKRAGHRICIASGLYAETTLLYQKGVYRPLPWTYLDYQGALVQNFLLERRRWLKELRREA